jgi:hypothetical protein
MLALVLLAVGAEPQPRFVVENKTAPAFVVVSKLAQPRETFRSADGLLYEKHPDGFYRQVPGQVRAPEVVPAPRPFRGAVRDPDHTCDRCGRSQFVVAGPGPVPGTHTHRCACGHSWFH